MTGILTLKRGGTRSARMAGVKSKRKKYSTSSRDTAKQPTVKKTKTKSYLDTLREQKDRTWEDARSKAASGVEERFRDESDKQFLQQMEDFNRKRIEEESKSGVIDRSDIVGYKDGLFGLNIGATPTGSGSTGGTDEKPGWYLNPDTGRKVFIKKARQGMTSSEYKDWIQNKITNDRMGKQSWERAFPIGSGKVLTDIAELLAPAPLKMASQLWKAATKPVETYENFIKKFGTNTDAKIADIQQDSKMTTDELINKTMDDRYRNYLNNFPQVTAPGETVKSLEEFKSAELGGPETDADAEEIFSETVYNPEKAERERKIQFINQALGTNFKTGDISTDRSLDQTYQHAKQKVGGGIKETIAGQFDFSNQGALNLSGAPTTTQETNPEIEGLKKQIDINTADPNVDIFTNNAFMGSGPNFPAGGVDTTADDIFGIDANSQRALDILNSNATRTFADGGSLNNYLNMSTFEKLKAMADATADAK